MGSADARIVVHRHCDSSALERREYAPRSDVHLAFLVSAQRSPRMLPIRSFGAGAALVTACASASPATPAWLIWPPKLRKTA